MPQPTTRVALIKNHSHFYLMPVLTGCREVAGHTHLRPDAGHSPLPQAARRRGISILPIYLHKIKQDSTGWR